MPSDVGDPTRSTSYALCVYDDGATAQPSIEARALAGGTCGKGACWKRLGARGFAYKNRRGGAGVIEARLIKSALYVRAVGDAASPAQMPLTTPVIVQLVNSETNACWHAAFDAAAENSSTRYRALGAH